MDTLLVLIPALPLSAAILVAATGRWLREQSHWPVVVALAASFVCSLFLLVEVQKQSSAHPANHVGFEHTVTLWQWANVERAYAPYGELPANDAPANAEGIGGALRSDSYDFNIGVTLRADALTAIMLAMVTFVSTLVAIYAAATCTGTLATGDSSPISGCSCSR